MHVEVELDEGRGPILVKRAVTPEDRARLARETDILSRIRHPGVVTMLAGREVDGGTELRLRWAGPHTLATTGPLPAEQAAGVVATLAETVADLHALGVVHTRLTRDHVLVGPEGQPVLCGFGEAGSPDRCAPSADVAALGALLGDLLDREDDGMEPIPDHRRPFRRRAAWPSFSPRALLTLADQAGADEHAARPTARAFAQAIRTAVPGIALPPPPQATSDGDQADAVPDDALGWGDDLSINDPLPSSVRRAVPIVAAIVGVALVVGGLRELRGDAGSSAAPGLPRRTPVPSTVATAPSPTDVTDPGSTTTTATTSTLPSCPDAGGTVDIDGDRCPDEVRVDGRQAVVAGVTYELGRPGDELAVGDWDCDGRATPALLRPSSGEVFVFDRWAQPGQDVTVPALEVVPGATDIAPGKATGAGCHPLLVDRREGSSSIVPVEPAP